MFILTWLMNFLGGGIVDKLTSIYAKQKDSQVEHERIQADVAKKQLDTELETQRLAQQVRVATAGFWEMRVITVGIALPFLLHLWLVGLDTCFGFGWRIAAFPSPFNDWEGRVLLSFFGIAVAGKAITSVVGGMIARRP